jgi:exodeoxyribonuclease V gamma subunit
LKESLNGTPSSGIHLIVSNRLETLGAAMADLLGQMDLPDPQTVLQPDIVLVQSKGMQRWLSMQVARHNGICANLRFPFPNAFIEDLCGRVMGAIPQRNLYEPEALAFRILRMLPTFHGKPLFEPVRSYFQDQTHPLKTFQLARKIADLFDQYMIYRPEMLAAWEAGRPFSAQALDWQGSLWQAIKRDVRIPHRADLQKELIARLRDSSSCCEILPRRIFVFGISHLPPFHLHVLKTLAERVAVYIFVSNPCRHFWFDIVSDRHLSRSQPQMDSGAAARDLHFERGNRLLASWGLMGKNFFNVLYDFEPQTSERFEDTAGDSLLSCIQQDILDLVDRPGNALSSKSGCSPDGTIRIHSCHSAMREVEVLHDQLLSLFETCDQLKPRDVLVMTPDINSYAPYIHAVFGTSQLVPYSVADQNMRSQSQVLEAFIHLLEVKDSRFEAGNVMALLEFDVIRERFDLTADDLPIVEEWVRKANIRWGWDGPDRKKQALPGFAENCWRAGLDRLLMGYAMAPAGEGLYEGILPFDSIEGSQSRVLGSLALFVETLYAKMRTLPDRAPMQKWREALTELLDSFFQASNSRDAEILLVRNLVNGLDQLAHDSDCQIEVAFEIIRHHIRDSLGGIITNTGFMVGGITFCAMLPMRSIPAQVICILGLQHDAFPQDLHEPKFNLIAAAPKPGDRSKRNDDKYLFLEALLSARRVFYLSYIGRRIQDNAQVPPSVLVDELIEYIYENYAILPDRLITEHPLQAFAPAYFTGDDRLYSYSAENLAAARKIRSPGASRTFFDSNLPEPSEEWRSLDQHQLIAFFHHPVRFLLKHRLGIQFRMDDNEIEDRETFNPDALGHYTIEQSVLKSLLAGISRRQSYAALRAAGALPHGSPGKVVFDRVTANSSNFIHLLKSYIAEESGQRVAVRLNIENFIVSGEIDQIFSIGQVMFRMAKMRPKDLLTVFLNHLALNAGPFNARPIKSILITKEAVWQFGDIADPCSVLKSYLDLYWLGLKRPLRFFPQSSYAFAFQRLIKELPVANAVKAARAKWNSSDYGKGEAEDPYTSCAYMEHEGLYADFQEIALAVFTPLLKSVQSHNTCM